MTREMQIIDLADTGEVQLNIVDGERRVEAEPAEFSVALTGADRQELDWYLIDSLSGEPDSGRSQAVETGLSNLGRLLFESVFASGEQAQTCFAQAKTQGLSEYGIVVISQRPQFLELPWELINEPETGYLASQLQWVVRRSTPEPLPSYPSPAEEPGQDQQFNVLLVSPLPSDDGSGDQPNGAHAGNMAGETLKVLESVDEEVILDVLRPPTFEALAQRLRERPGHYHLVHLDAVAVAEEQGTILFEDGMGGADPVDLGRAAQALAGGLVPIVLVTSGPQVESSQATPSLTSSLASPFVPFLIEAKIPVVVSVAYPLSAPARRLFAETFYPAVIKGEGVGLAAAQVRRALMGDPHRPSALGNLVHWDWHLPTVHQTAEYAPPALVKEQPGPLAQPQPVPEDAGGGTELPQGGPHGLVGRRREIRRLENLFGQSPLVLLSGNTGVGKTELALGFANWIQKTSTQQMPGGVFYTSFDVGAGLERVVHEIGTAVAGLEFADLPGDAQREWVIDYLKEHPSLLVWDSLERVAGFPRPDTPGLLDAEEQTALNQFLEQVVAGGGTWVLLVSRSQTEPWLTVEHQEFLLKGLEGGDRIELGGLLLPGTATVSPRAPGIQSHLGASYLELLELIEGHPLAMQIALPMLDSTPASVVAGELATRTEETSEQGSQESEEDGRDRFLTAVMDYSFSRMPRRSRAHLPFLSLFQRRVMMDVLTHITQERPYRMVMGEELGWGACRTLLRSARDAGFLEPVTPSVYQINPAFPWFYGRGLHQQVRQAGVRDLEREFVRVYADTADYFLETLYENQDSGATAVLAEEGNITQALGLALEDQQWDTAQVLVQPLAQVYRMQKRYPELRRLRRQLIETVAPESGAAEEAQQRGGIELWLYLMGTESSEATDLGDLTRSEELNGLLLSYLESQPEGDQDPRTASVYHQFGVIAQSRWQLEPAEEWFQKSLAIIEAGEDRESVADDYFCLGQIRLHQRLYTEAKDWYSKALEIHQRLQDPEEMVKDYRALGLAAQYRFENDEAESWYQRARAILEENRDEETAILVYHELGTVYHARYDYEEADRWYKQALTLSDQLGKQEQMALEFHYLGLMEQSQDLFIEDAENWFELALAKRQELEDIKGVGDESRQLGVLFHEHKRLEEAEQWYRKALDIFQELEDVQRVSRTLGQLAMVEEERGNLAASLEWAHRVYQLALDHDLPVLVQVKSHLARLRDSFGEDAFAEWWRGSTGGDPPTDLDVDTSTIL
ncbi:MAG: hypothetical protein BZY80_05060 [SAR202 cluster bacterium Io17-Chloro-G2]|nr:MAG: hypothetical protein BZY80_05060 [SAR202 cluster bacterium Io17-Chloro-G2]